MNMSPSLIELATPLQLIMSDYILGCDIVTNFSSLIMLSSVKDARKKKVFYL